MEDSKFLAFAGKLRPKLAELRGEQWIRAFMEFNTVLFTVPYVAAALIWLAIVVDLSVISPHLLLFFILTILLSLVQRQPFTLYLNVQEGKAVPLVGSLSNLVLWSGLLILGPSALLIPLLVVSGNTLWNGWQRYRIDRNAFWVSLSLFTQEVAVSIFSGLVALTVYQLAGGTFPLTGWHITDWLPALYAVLIHAFLPGLILLPIIMQLNRLTGTPNSPAVIVSFLFSVAILTLFIAPFALLASLLYVTGGLLLFLFFMTGVFLVNFLAHYLSRTNERSRQRARELARLSYLSEAIIQAPADASTLQELISQQVGRMFPDDIVVISLFGLSEEAEIHPATANFVWPTFHISHPPQTTAVDEAIWQQLQAATTSHLQLQNVKLPGMQTVYGDAAVVKIMAPIPRVDSSAQESVTTVCVGGIYLLRRKSVGDIADSLSAVQSLASQIGSALYRAQVYVQTLAHQKVVQELEFAGHIQASFLPRETPTIPGWDIAASLIPARQTSGDFYDFVPLENGCLGILVADVADKGTGAALFMALSRTLTRTYATQYPQAPDQVLAATNERILADTESDQFVTVFYGLLDPDRGTLTYANAGHNPAFVIEEGGKIHTLGHTGIPLGMFEGMSWQPKTIQLSPGDILAVYTDGASEAQNAAAVEFGTERLLTAVQSKGTHTAHDIVQALVSAIDDFVGATPQFDDITLLVAVRQGD